MKKTLWRISRILIIAIIASWIISDIAAQLGFPNVVHDFWEYKHLYLALVAWSLFDLGYYLGSRNRIKACHSHRTIIPFCGRNGEETISVCAHKGCNK